ncbi:NYN domain-containing protein [Bradyrhizobium icense]|uniref:NYN domain-containing protein n=1 Tax=Bradyrhizobium icense TaxID=1274631 RepID=A0A1B1UDT7_9BRAD|nr:NYN domain-containing protein [Bradyrhizobium icense]ANW00918.1 NYN domain-containing protein [Bradyrhizobium icense]
MTDRVALFIDFANLQYAAENLGFEIDYKKLLHEFSKSDTLVRAYFYTTFREGEFDAVRPLANWLDYNGFTVRTKSIKEYRNHEGRRRTARSIGIELAIDALEIGRRVDHIFLFSGDGDFRRLVEGVQRLGAKVSVVSSIRTKPPMLADDLRRQADSFIDLFAIKNSISRPLQSRERDP